MRESIITRRPTRDDRAGVAARSAGSRGAAAGKIARVEVSTDSGRRGSDASFEEPVRSKAHTRFTHMWNWPGAETVILSRADRRDRIRSADARRAIRVRGAGTQYHFNPIYGWRVMPNGRVFLLRCNVRRCIGSRSRR